MKKYSVYDFLPRIVKKEKNTLENILDDETNKGTQSMYDILLMYLPQLNDNFDTWNLVSKLNTIRNETNTKRKVDFSEYFIQIANWLRVSINPSISIPNRKEIVSITFSEEQKDILLDKLKKITKLDSNCENFTTIEEFINYAQKLILEKNKLEDNENIDSTLIDFILKLGIYVSTKSSQLELKYAMVVAYVGEVRKSLSEKIVQQNQLDDNKSEIEIFEFIESVLISKNKFINYERFLDEYCNRINKFALETEQEMGISARRDDFVVQSLLQGLTTAKRRVAQKTSIEQVLYGDDVDFEIAYKDDIQWHIEPYDKPQILCDRYTNYSDDQEIKQRVIAVSYGKLHYKIGMINNAIVQPEIIGVTRIGKDGVSNYFAVAPLDSVFFKTIEELQEDELSDSIVNLLFSDYNMKNAKSRNNFYVGSIFMKNGNPVLSAQDMTDKEALYQATLIEGEVCLVLPNGNKMEGKMTLDEFLNSNALESLHYSVLSTRNK